MASPPAAHGPSQERLLLDYVHRLEKHKEGRVAQHLHLSRLKTVNRRDHHLRVAAGNFEPLIQRLQGQLFRLKSGDLVFIHLKQAEPAAETAVQQVRYLFGDDPLIADEGAQGNRFSTRYDVETQFEDLLNLVQGLIDAEHKRQPAPSAQMDTRAAIRARQQLGEPMTPEVLTRVEGALARADLSNLVRRQFACTINPRGAPEAVFSELYISIKDLRETMIPGVNLASDRWLFQHLTETLDRRMLSMLSKTDHITISGDISFNLNIATLLSPQFLTFDDAVPASRRGHMIVELLPVDIFSNLGAFLFAREFLQERGYRVCLDGLTYPMMPLIDRERLGADILKLIWHPDMADGGTELHDEIASLVRRSEQGRVVMCRCDDRESVDFARSVGIAIFQGRQIEGMIAEENRKRDLRRLKARIQNS